MPRGTMCGESLPCAPPPKSRSGQAGFTICAGSIKRSPRTAGVGAPAVFDGPAETLRAPVAVPQSPGSAHRTDGRSV